MKLYYQTFGQAIALAIEGENETEVLQQYYSLWNHDATNGEFHWINEPYLGYIWTNEKKLNKALVNSSLHLILNQRPDFYKNTKRGAILEARELASKRKSEIEEMEFIVSNKVDMDVFRIGNIESVENKKYDIAVDAV